MKLFIPLSSAIASIVLCAGVPSLATPASKALTATVLDGMTLDSANPDDNLIVDCDYHPPEKGMHTLANGDPGYPAEPASIELNSITCARTLCFKSDGATLTIAPGSDLTALFPVAGLAKLEDLLIQEAENERADQREQALIDRYESRMEPAYA